MATDQLATPAISNLSQNGIFLKEEVVIFKSIISVSLTLFLGAPYATGSTFRCKGKIMSIQDQMVSVLAKCGQPTHKGTFTETTTNSSGISVINTLDTWFYDFGPNVFKQILTFRNGRLIKIEDYK